MKNLESLKSMQEVVNMEVAFSLLRKAKGEGYISACKADFTECLTKAKKAMKKACMDGLTSYEAMTCPLYWTVTFTDKYDEKAGCHKYGLAYEKKLMTLEEIVSRSLTGTAHDAIIEDAKTVYTMMNEDAVLINQAGTNIKGKATTSAVKKYVDKAMQYIEGTKEGAKCARTMSFQVTALKAQFRKYTKLDDKYMPVSFEAFKTAYVKFLTGVAIGRSATIATKDDLKDMKGIEAFLPTETTEEKAS